jgi:hypothetical protein
MHFAIGRSALPSQGQRHCRSVPRGQHFLDLVGGRGFGSGARHRVVLVALRSTFVGCRKIVGK